MFRFGSGHSIETHDGAASPPPKDSSRQEESHASKECHGVQDFHEFHNAQRRVSAVSKRSQ
jgi:hypothetical protein